MTRQEQEDRLNALATIVLDREAYLLSTDYISAKLAEGVATKEEYADQLAKRNEARNAINQARDEIAFLNSVTPEDDDLIPHRDEFDVEMKDN